MWRYLRNLGVETDIWLSVLAGGPDGVTISMRVALARQRGSRPACWVCAALSRLVERDHCGKQIQGTTTAPDAALRAGLLIGLAFALIVYGVPWLLRRLPWLLLLVICLCPLDWFTLDKNGLL